MCSEINENLEGGRNQVFFSLTFLEGGFFIGGFFAHKKMEVAKCKRLCGRRNQTSRGEKISYFDASLLCDSVPLVDRIHAVLHSFQGLHLEKKWHFLHYLSALKQERGAESKHPPHYLPPLHPSLSSPIRKSSDEELKQPRCYSSAKVRRVEYQVPYL